MSDSDGESGPDFFEGGGKHARVEYGDERDPKMRAFLEKGSPLTSAGNITKPMFIYAGVKFVEDNLLR